MHKMYVHNCSNIALHTFFAILTFSFRFFLLLIILLLIPFWQAVCVCVCMFACNRAFYVKVTCRNRNPICFSYNELNESVVCNCTDFLCILTENVYVFFFLGSCHIRFLDYKTPIVDVLCACDLFLLVKNFDQNASFAQLFHVFNADIFYIKFQNMIGLCKVSFSLDNFQIGVFAIFFIDILPISHLRNSWPYIYFFV